MRGVYCAGNSESGSTWPLLAGFARGLSAPFGIVSVYRVEFFSSSRTSQPSVVVIADESPRRTEVTEPILMTPADTKVPPIMPSVQLLP